MCSIQALALCKDVKGRGWGTGAGDSPTGYYVERIEQKNSQNIWSAANMAGFMGVDSLRSEIELNLEWLYDRNITYTKQVIDGSQIKDFVNTLLPKGKRIKLSLSSGYLQFVMFDNKIKGTVALFIVRTRLEIENYNFCRFFYDDYGLCFEILAYQLL